MFSSYAMSAYASTLVPRLTARLCYLEVTWSSRVNTLKLASLYYWGSSSHKLLDTVSYLTSTFSFGKSFSHPVLRPRNLSVIGGLLMVLSDSLHRRKIAFAGLPELSDPSSTNRTYFQLAGRVLLIFLFLGFIFKGDRWSALRIFISTFGLLACIMVAVGFKAKYSAMFLVALLSVGNILINNFWSVGSGHPHRDFLKYSILFHVLT